MADKAKEEQQRREDSQKEYQKFIEDSYSKLWRWQLDNDRVVFPFLLGPWVPGNPQISTELGFRKMSADERKLIESELAKQSGIILPK